MSTSEIAFRAGKFSANDAVLRVWLKLLIAEFDQFEDRPAWLDELRDDWDIQATHEFDYGIVLELDRYLCQPGRSQVVLSAATQAVERLRAFGDPIPAATLNGLGAGEPESPFLRDLPASLFIEAAEDFIDLVEDDDESQASVMTKEDLRLAMEAHERWLANPVTGSRLKLSGTQLARASLAGVALMRARLTRVNLGGADLRNAKFVRCDLDGVNFDGANLDNALFDRAKVRHCSFDGASAVGATFEQTLLEHTSFLEAHCDGITISGSVINAGAMGGAVLTNARLRCSVNGQLQKCNFAQSDLRHSRFTGADLRGANFEETLLFKTTFVKALVNGARGVPFIADQVGGSDLDFSAAGDGSAPGTLAMLREQLGASMGAEPWGSGTMPERYRALRIEEGVTTSFSIERRDTEVEVIQVLRLYAEDRRLWIHYRIADERLVDRVVQDLIFKVLLGALLGHELREKVDQIRFINVETNVESSRPYDLP
jgi:uncharacterized protein YjbI with pentapeptide repeats